MKFLFLLSLLLHESLPITADNRLIWGKITDGDELMFNYTYKEPGMDYEGIHRIKFRVPNEGETEFYNITFVSLENRNGENADMRITNGGVGKSFVNLHVQYPKSAPADVRFIVRGVYDPCKK